MLEFARWKYALIAIVLTFSILYALPNIFPKDPSVQIAATGTLVPDAALAARAEAILKSKNIGYKKIAVEGDKLMVRLSTPEDQTRAADVLRPEFSGDYNVALNLASNTPAWLGKIGARPMTLGLDLQGGVHFLMEVDQAKALEKRENTYAEEIRDALKDNKIAGSDVNLTSTGILVTFSDTASKNKGFNLLRLSIPKLTFEEQADGKSLAVTITKAELQAIADAAIEQNIITLRNRMQALGEPIIQRQGTNRIIVQLPGIQDTAKAKELLGGTATLEYRAVIENSDPYAVMAGAPEPLGSRLYYMHKQNSTDPSVPVLLSKRVIISGDQLVTATASNDQQSGETIVSIKLDSAGGKRMFRHTLENTGKRMAVVFIERIPTTRMVDGKEIRTFRETKEVISDATIQGVFGAQFQTTGLTRAQANKLSEQLKGGSLAAPVDIVEERVVGPSLGAENVKSGIQAVVFSFVFVLVFFLIYYKTFGIITNMALLMQLLMVVAIMSLPFIDATLTLPGFAGIALTVGMSVDANVLINERIREELRLGNTPLASIAAGYDKATGTIADSNITALLAGLAMAVFGSGPISGFGITLIIGILTSMYTAVSVSRGIATLIYGGRRKMTGLSI